MLETTHKELLATLERFSSQLPLVEESGHALIRSLRQGGSILSCGNGGSAADALHLAEELIGRYRAERRSLPAVCLAADATALTCIANDYGFDEIFSRQVSGLGREGDVLVGFTTSGNSPNVLKALEAARAEGLFTICLAGKDGGRAKGLADLDIIVPSENTARIQEVHTFILHSWLEMVEGESW